jgi:Ni/Fe-hydrogenase subunit HybB-like protein
MTIFESSLSSRKFGRQLEMPVLIELGGALLVVLCINALLRFEDFFHRGQLANIFKPSYEAYFLWIELALAFILPISLLSFKKIRHSPNGLYLAAVSCLLGFVTNRLNVSVTGFETWVGHHYVPKWTEFMITLSIIAAGFALFGIAVKYLPIFPEEEHTAARPLEAKAGPVPVAPVLEHAGD